MTVRQWNDQKWKQLEERVLDYEIQTTPKWVKERGKILGAIETADRLLIKAPRVNTIRIGDLRLIVDHLNAAAVEQDSRELRNLFDLVSRHTTRDIQRMLGIRDEEPIEEPIIQPVAQPVIQAGCPWDDLKSRVLAHTENNYTWASERKSILYAIEVAQRADLNVQGICQTSLANLRTIAPKAARSASSGDSQELARLFEMAASMNNADLRIALGKQREKIKAVRHGENVTVTMSEYQMGRIAHNMRQRYDFEIEQEPERPARTEDPEPEFRRYNGWFR